MPKKKSNNHPNLEKIITDCYGLKVYELKALRDAVDALIELSEDEREELTDGEGKARARLLASGAGGSGKAGYIEKKIINGCGPYLYLRVRINGNNRSFYLGKGAE
ncbi:MAG: hypothetical protein N5P05_004232 (plasmid) [Chroococcopsis gigantea SAG 12.99]|jgi:hypothetical protein|nr:hypothetical protein [Chroococcopsis gigantea SAG 12.99]